MTWRQDLNAYYAAREAKLLASGDVTGERVPIFWQDVARREARVAEMSEPECREELEWWQKFMAEKRAAEAAGVSFVDFMKQKLSEMKQQSPH